MALQDQRLMGVMDKNESLFYCDNEEKMKALIQAHADAIWFYNQNPDVIEIMDSIVYPDGQQCIEIFQDTEGVFGLRGYQQIGKIQTPVTLELSDITDEPGA